MKQDTGDQFVQLMIFLNDRFDKVENKLENKADKILVQENT